MTAPAISRPKTGRTQGAAARAAKRREALIEDYLWLLDADPRIHEEMACKRLGVTPRTLTRIKSAIRDRESARSVTA